MYSTTSSELMAKISSQSFVSCAPPWFGRVSCDTEVEHPAVVDGSEKNFSMEAVKAEGLSVKELAAEDDEPLMEESEVKLGRGNSRRGANQ
jgi:hypothetical protein